MNSHLIDFHHGWLIEIVPLEQGSQAICFSPCRQRLIVDLPFSDFDALYLAKQEIDYQLARNSVSSLLRELYETGCLQIEEWKMLQQSLLRIVRAE